MKKISVKKGLRVSGVLVFAVFLASCKITMHAGEGGGIKSGSGSNNCPETESCVVDIENGEPFSDIFTAVPTLGNVFAGWGRGLCGGDVTPCDIPLSAELTEYEFDGKLDARFEPFEPAHMILSGYSVGAVAGLSFLNYSWRWNDVEGATGSNKLIISTSGCSVSASVLTPPAGNRDGVVGSGGCEQDSELLLSKSGRPGLVIPKVKPADTVFFERDIDIDFSSLSKSSNAFSTSIATVTTKNTSNGIATEGYYHSFYAKKSTNAKMTKLAGDWALTRLEIEVSPDFEALYTVLTFPAEIVTKGGGALAVDEEVEFIESEFKHYFDGSPVKKTRFETTSGEQFSLPLTLTPDGKLTLNAGDRDQPGRKPQIMAGFIAPGHDFFVLAEGVPGIYALRDGNLELPPLNEFSANQLMVGIKKNATPNLTGKKYRMVGVKFDVNNQGFNVSPWSNDAFLKFTSNKNGRWKKNEEGQKVAFGNSDGKGISGTASSKVVKFSYTVESDGRIFFDLAGLPNLDQDLINGYASLDNKVLVFSHALSLAGGTKGEIGMWVALCTNCD
ncbi:MAG: hypothetical protein V7754_19495 [Halioglobus sp.]